MSSYKLFTAEYLETSPINHLRWKFFAKIVNDFYSRYLFPQKCSIVDVQSNSQNASDS